ncbi:hypothetical protein [Occallatibacter savannae]|uniref:hypothetical protein n=1 Tax=Occallatibacter savannae TaxID=1002691 RepID=UPI000D69F982|nr:hypothetical protein [Occallatibacter savannae]
MAKVRSFLIFILLVILSHSSMAQQGTDGRAKTCVAPQAATDPKFSPGQVWSYRTRRGEESSTITVLRIERLPNAGVIVHVRISGIHLKNCSGGPSPTNIGHTPISREALDRSVTKLIEQGRTLPDYEEGYNQWRQACGGVYTIAVADLVKADEETFNSQWNCSSP